MTLKTIREILPGLFVSVLVGYISIFISILIPKVGSINFYIFRYVCRKPIFKSKGISKGYKFSETDLLSYSIVLLGATLSVSTLIDLKVSGILFIILQMTITIIVHFI